MFFWGQQDENYIMLEKQYRSARAKFNKAKKNSVKYHIQNCNDHNQRVRAIVDYRCATEELTIALNNFNQYRVQLGMRMLYIQGINC